MIDIVINGDNRVGYLNTKITVGDYGEGSLQGVRSIDLLLDGVRNKMNFFRGYETRCIFFIDVHQPIPDYLLQEIEQLVLSYGNNSKLILHPHSKEKYRWNDHLYIEALKYAEGDYIVHFDNDSNAYRRDDVGIIERYFKWLDEGYKYICQPWDRIGDPMYHASTRFFICKRETLDLPLFERSIYINPLNGKHNPCLEFVLGILAGDGNVLYPEREDEDYIIFCWASYFSGLLKHLNSLPYEEVKKYILDCGLFGSHDIISKPTPVYKKSTNI